MLIDALGATRTLRLPQGCSKVLSAAMQSYRLGCSLQPKKESQGRAGPLLHESSSAHLLTNTDIQQRNRTANYCIARSYAQPPALWTK